MRATTAARILAFASFSYDPVCGSLLLRDLNPECAPGGNFNLNPWQLQLPTGPPNNPTQIPPSQLVGCDGYTDSHFFTDAQGDGSMVMQAPGSNSGCTKFVESAHCRTEFTEITGDWDPFASVNRMMVQMKAIRGSNICVGQLFQAGGAPNKPLAEIYYYSDGTFHVGNPQTPPGGNQVLQTLQGVNVPHNQIFKMELRYEEGVASISINDGGFIKLNKKFDPPRAFFKTGNYNQADDDASVHVYSLDVQHEA
ncbi:polysaccharide lyase family 7 protein [Zasmidium cellare ATCC 36951]|uniref:Polysaccharide lyase family 7 protein n=1 Tax=Zasmidium cellare ATCC 36951 TaxID=1080233 RepID=A0A6A6C2U2_ZASCE|nr:polysaccharide lyase family 7 protein [Zasmidium cellare ATCC 36951]KAF2160500.1 polysaccharide lyase family 7 protein [Zasmidium cellare ATCC 36951]